MCQEVIVLTFLFEQDSAVTSLIIGQPNILHSGTEMQKKNVIYDQRLSKFISSGFFSNFKLNLE